MILTEEELKKISKTKVFKPMGVSWEVVDDIINSHLELFRANAGLSYELMMLQYAYNKLIRED